jgi:hypothetical protein
MTLKLVKDRAKQAMTLVEVLMTVLIMGLLIYSLYTIFIKTSKAADTAEWKSNTQKKLRMLTKGLYEDLMKATHPSVIRPNKVDMDLTKGVLTFKQGTFEPLKSQGTVLSFLICRPAKTGFGAEDRGPAQMKVELVSEPQTSGPGIPAGKSRSRLYYRRTTSDKEFEPDAREMDVFDVEVIRSQVTEARDDPSKHMLEMEFIARHPKHPNTTITEQIKVKIDVLTKSE